MPIGEILDPLEVARLRRTVSSVPLIYSDHGYNWTLHQLMRLTGFDAATRAYPDSEIVIVLHTVRLATASAFLIHYPRCLVTRASNRGQKVAAAEPFWRHGSVMHISSDTSVPGAKP